MLPWIIATVISALSLLAVLVMFMRSTVATSRVRFAIERARQEQHQQISDLSEDLLKFIRNQVEFNNNQLEHNAILEQMNLSQKKINEGLSFFLVRNKGRPT